MILELDSIYWFYIAFFSKIVAYATDDPKVIIGDRSNLQFTQVKIIHEMKQNSFLIEEIRSSKGSL